MAGYLPDVDVRDLSRRTAAGMGESGPQRGNFTRGVLAGVDQTQGLLYGAGAAVADTVGADGLAERAIAGYQDNMWEAQEHAGDVMRVEDIGSLGDAGSWAAYQIGAQLPILASIIGTGGAAGAVGSVAAKKYLQKQIGTKAAALTAGGLAEREALQLAAATVTRAAARKAAAAGTTGASVGLSTGSIMGRVEEETGEMRGGTALAFGALAGTLDAVPLLRLASKIGVPPSEARRGIASKVKAAGLEALKSGGIEAMTETAQTALELAAVDWVEESGLFEQMSEEDLSELVNAAASGALLGFAMGGAAGTAATFGAQSNAASELDEIEAELRTRAGQPPDLDLGGGTAPSEGGAAPSEDVGTPGRPAAPATPADAFDVAAAPGIDLGDPDAAVERATETYERRRDQILDLARERMAAGDQEAPGRMRAQLDELQQKLQRVQRAAAEAKQRTEAREGELQPAAPRVRETAGRGAGEALEGRADPAFEVDGQGPVDLGTPDPDVDVGAPDPDVDVGAPARPVDGELVDAAPAPRRVPIGRIGEVIDGEAVDVTAGDAKPWKTERAAARALARRAPGPGYAVAPVDGGFVLRRDAPAPGTREAIDAAANQAATSPTNDLPEPTQAQKEAGTYRMGHTKVAGLDVSIENPRGSYRRGTAPDGTPWKTKMASHYGYVRGSEAIDGDHVDVFLGQDASDASLPVHVVDQVDPDTGAYDEPKVMIGFRSADDARRGYLANYDAGWQGLGAITPMAMADFKRWVKSPDAMKPLALPAPAQETPDATPSLAAAAVDPAPRAAPAAPATPRAAMDAGPAEGPRTDAPRPAAPVASAPVPAARALTPKQRAREARRVRPETDDLLLAIRKLGGIDVVEESDFRGRLKPTDDTSLFGMPGIEQTRPGRGRTLDSLVPTLFELGYLRQGTDSRELAALLSRAELGDPIYGFGVSDAQLEQDADASRAPDDYVPYEAPDTLDEFMAATPTAEAYASADGAGRRPGYDYPPDVDSDARTLSALLDDLEGLGVPRANIEATVESMARAGDDTPTIMAELFTLAEDMTDAQPTAERAGPEGARAPEDAPLLDSYDDADIAAREAAGRDAAASARAEQRRSDAQDTADDFLLTGSDREADQAAARGQDSLFSRPKAKATPAPRTTATDAGQAFETGQPVTFTFAHNTDSATARMGRPKKGDSFGRDKEPSGRYVIAAPRPAADAELPGTVYGELTFANPLVLELDGWKPALSAEFGGLTGKRLSKAVIAAGHDGIVTADRYGTTEIVDLTTFDEAKALYNRPSVAIDADRAPRTGGVSVGEARKIVKRVSRNWTGGPPIAVVESIGEVPGVAEAYRGDTQIRGVYSNRLGKVFIVAPSIPNALEVERTLLHEVQHFAGRAAYGREARAKLEALADLVRSQHGSVADYVSKRGLDYDYAWYNQSFLDAGLPQRQADAKHVDELLAIMASDRATGGGRIRAAARSAIAELRRWLRSIGLQLTSSLPDDALVTALNETQQVLTGGRAPSLRPIRSRATNAHRVWHGSPARFDKFDLAYLDSGEGSQHEGHGLYFSDAREVGEWYRSQYAAPDQARFRGEAIDETSVPNTHLMRALRGLVGKKMPNDRLFAERREFEVERLGGEAEMSEQLARENPNESDRAFYAEQAALLQEAATAMGAVSRDDFAFERQGAVYQVELAPQEDEYLDFEAPLGQQSDVVTQALEAAGYPVRASVVEQDGEFAVMDLTGEEIDSFTDREDAEGFARELDEGGPGEPTGRDMYDQLVLERTSTNGGDQMAAQKGASEFLMGIGIRGNRYQGGGVDGMTGTRATNYVVFDDADAVIEATFARTKEKRDLVVLHNLSEQNLAHADRMGGLPVPSLAITRTDQEFTSFGGVTLVARPDMAFGDGSKAFNADIYSPRYPRVRVKTSTPKLDKIVEGLTYSNFDHVESVVQSEGMRELAYSGKLMLDFLEQTGRAVRPVKAKADLAPELLPFAKRPKSDRRSSTLEQDPSFRTAVAAMIARNNATLRDAGETFQLDPDPSPRDLQRAAMDVAAAPAPGDLDTRAMEAAAKKRVQSKKLGDEFEAWGRELLTPAIASERIVAGETRDGDVRMRPHTLADVVTAMKGRIQGGEGMNYGVGTIRSAVARPVRSTADARRMRGQLAPAAEMKGVQEGFEQRLRELSEALAPLYKYDADDFGYTDAVAENLFEAGSSGRLRDFGKLPADLAAQVDQFMSDLKDAPTAYFEAKPQRAVRLEEFAAAIVPKGTTQQTRDTLARHGLEVIEIGKAKNARKKALDGLGDDVLFSRPGAPGGPGGPRPPPSGPVARAVAALRDGARAAAASSSPAIKRYVRRNFSKEGLIDDGTFQEKLRADAMKNVGEMEVSMLVRDLENAVAAAFNVKRYTAARPEDLARVNQALAGDDVVLPADLQEVIDTLRAHLDTLSAKTNESVADLIELDMARLSDDERAGVEAFVESDGEIGEAPGRLERLLRTSWAIQRNMGKYVHRSYQAFNDPDWKAKVLADTDLITRVEAFVAQRNPDLTANEVTGAVRAILQAAAKTSSMVELVGGSSMLGAKDVTILKKREDVPPVIRELLGEYTDPRVNFAKSSTAMYNLVANHHFLMRVRENGLGAFLYEKPTGSFDDQLAGEDSDTMSPLNGLYTSEDFRQGMQDHAGKPMEDGWLKSALKITAMVKYGKVILSPATQLRNVQSALGFLVANGHFDFRELGKGFQATRADLFTKDEAWRAYLKDLIGLGVLHDNPNSGELRAVLKDFTDQDLWAPGARGGMNRFFDFMTKLYQVGDDLIKIAGFENEIALAQSQGMSLEAARQQAAVRIRDGYPTYSQVPRVIRGLRRSPLVGAFTSFASETIRTTYNQVRFIKEDHDRGHMASRNRRILGLTLMSASAYTASKLSMMMMGFSDEDDEAIRDLLPPWSKNSQLLYLGQNDDGLPLYYDMSYMDPMDFIKRPIVAMLNGNNEGLDRKVLDAGKEFLMPFLGPEIAAGATFEILSNKKMGGGAIWNPHDATEDKGAKILNHLRKALQPGFMANAERTWLAVQGEVSVSGRAYTLSGEGLGWLGHRVSTLDVRQALVYKAYEMADATRGASQIISKVAGSPQSQSDADIQSAFDSMQRARRLGFQKMTRLARGAEGLGVPRGQIMAAMKVARIKESDREAVMEGRVPDWEPGKRFTQSAEDRLTLSAPNRERRADLQRELARRRRLIDRMVTEIQTGATR